jgi:hypothetical protein
MEKIIDLLKKLNSKETAAIITLITSCVSGVMFIENRYAKLVATQESLSLQQTQIIQLQHQILSLVNSLPEDIRVEIVKRSSLEKAMNIDKSNFINNK